MRQNTQSIERLISKFGTLSSVGKKTAMRYAYNIVDMPLEQVQDFCDAMMEVKQKVKYCIKCATFCETEMCEICQMRKSNVLCVVAYPRDVLSIERTRGYDGLYHVLHGTISPIDGRGPDDLRIKELLARLDGSIDEVIIATNPDIEGDVTAMYIARLLKPLNIKASRIAQGISIGSDIEYVDETTLTRAISNRVEI